MILVFYRSVYFSIGSVYVTYAHCQRTDVTGPSRSAKPHFTQQMRHSQHPRNFLVWLLTIRVVHCCDRGAVERN